MNDLIRGSYFPTRSPWKPAEFCWGSRVSLFDFVYFKLSITYLFLPLITFAGNKMHANIQAEIATALLAKTLTDRHQNPLRDRLASTKFTRKILTDEQNHKVGRVHSKADQKI